MYLGNFESQQTVDFVFNTSGPAGGATLSGSPSLRVYKANSASESTAGITLTVDFDALTGLNHVRIATTDSFYAVANDYSVVIAAGTVNGVSVVGTRVASFSIENRSINGATNTELSAIPAATAPNSTILRFLFMLCRNRLTQSATTQTLYKDDSATSIGTASTSDSGSLFERSKFS